MAATRAAEGAEATEEDVAGPRTVEVLGAGTLAGASAVELVGTRTTEAGTKAVDASGTGVVPGTTGAVDVAQAEDTASVIVLERLPKYWRLNLAMCSGPTS